MRSSWPRKSLLPLVEHMQPYIAITDVFDHLERCKARFERREPEVRAFLPEVGRFERLQREAQELAARFPEPQGRPPLYGVLVGVKDIFHVEGFATRAGSQLPPEALAGPEAECVRALKAAGALILGKTVTTEFAYFAPGPTRNPHNPEHTPGGSSSGSAAAVGAGLCDLALGTQTIGSIVRPAAFCGVVGFKPSYARVSRKGVIPLAPALDHVGWFAPAVPEAVQAAHVLFIDWRELDPPQDKPVLGVPEGSYLEQASADGLAHFRRVCQQLSGRGYQLLQVPAMPDFQEIRARHELLFSFRSLVRPRRLVCRARSLLRAADRRTDPPRPGGIDRRSGARPGGTRPVAGGTDRVDDHGGHRPVDLTLRPRSGAQRLEQHRRSGDEPALDTGGHAEPQSALRDERSRAALGLAGHRALVRGRGAAGLGDGS